MQKRKKSSNLIEILRHIKPYHIIILILLVLTNTMAWMIYSNTVSTQFDVHVRSWKVNFTDDEDIAISDDYQMSADDVFPGMVSFSDNIYVDNTGELNAELSYTLLKVQMFDESVIYTREGAIREGLTDYSSFPTSDELAHSLSSNYPFTITFTLNNKYFDEITTGGTTTSKARLTTVISWPYETTNYTFSNKVTSGQYCSCGTTCGTVDNETANACYDTACASNTCYSTKIRELSDLDDTEWGEKAYEFRESNPTEPSIKIYLILTVKQRTSS